MLTPISIEKFADGVMKNNKDYNRRADPDAARNAGRKEKRCEVHDMRCADGNRRQSFRILERLDNGGTGVALVGQYIALVVGLDRRNG